MPAALSAQLRAADRPLRIVGGGTWLHGGGPWAEAEQIHVGHRRGVIEYRPGDLVITVGAGTTMRELASVTAEHGQMLALAPYGSPDSTIGAVVATAAAAPLPFGDYTVRDLVLGLQVVTAQGDITHAGGRVVKNVAGFDLVRLHTGAFGTLGVITEVSLRLHARPLVDAVVTGTLQHTDAGALDDLLTRLVAQRAPLPMLLHGTPDGQTRLWARVSGNAARAAALRTHLLALGVQHLVDVLPEQVQAQLHDTPHDALVLRARTHRSDAAPFVRAARDAFPEATLSYDPLRGGMRLLLPPHTARTLSRDLATWYRLAAAHGAMHTISLAVDQGNHIGPVGDRARTALDTRVKQAFDPRDILNRLAPVPHAALAHADA